MHVLVTGGFGSIGAYVVRELAGRGHEVRVLGLPSKQARRTARELPVEAVWGDVRDRAVVDAAVAGVDAVIHMAAIIPPGSDADPERARSVNVGGTATVIAACEAAAAPPRLLFISTLDVHGRTQDREPPRRVTDPLVGTDVYSESKIEGERLVQASSLDWAIVRLADVPIIGMRSPEPIMFEIGAHNRIEAMHPLDTALALANALDVPEMWGSIHFIGGGASGQVIYLDYLNRILAAMGIGPLPDRIFRKADYVTDWLDSADSEALLHYQRHTFQDIVDDIAKSAGWRRGLIRLVGPIARWTIIRMSPYGKKA